MSTVDYNLFLIDWSAEPNDDRERRIRQAVIRRVTQTSTGASWELESLADDPEVIASDLKSAIEAARKMELDERERRRRANNAALVRLAIAEEAADEVAIAKSLDRPEEAFTIPSASGSGL